MTAIETLVKDLNELDKVHIWTERSLSLTLESGATPPLPFIGASEEDMPLLVDLAMRLSYEAGRQVGLRESQI